MRKFIVFALKCFETATINITVTHFFSHGPKDHHSPSHRHHHYLSRTQRATKRTGWSQLGGMTVEEQLSEQNGVTLKQPKVKMSR